MGWVRPHTSKTNQTNPPPDPTNGGSTFHIQIALHRLQQNNTLKPGATNTSPAKNVKIDPILLDIDIQVANANYHLDNVKEKSPLQTVIAETKYAIEVMESALTATTRHEREAERAKASLLTDKLAGYANTIASLEAEEAELAMLLQNYRELYQSALILDAKRNDRTQNAVGLSGDLKILFPEIRKTASAFTTTEKRYVTKRQDLYNALSNLRDNAGYKADKLAAMQAAPTPGGG